MRLLWRPGRPSLTADVVIMLIAGCALVAYTVWTKPLTEADAAVREGDLEGALKLYAVSEARFGQLRFAKQLLKRNYDRLGSNQLWLLYALKRFDDTIETADRHGATAASEFWSGCALFEKARAETQVPSQVLWIGRANEAFRKALELAPEDWDTKFNYEVTARVLAGLRKQPGKASEPTMQMLEPESDELSKRPVRKTG